MCQTKIDFIDVQDDFFTEQQDELDRKKLEVKFEAIRLTTKGTQPLPMLVPSLPPHPQDESDELGLAASQDEFEPLDNDETKPIGALESIKIVRTEFQKLKPAPLSEWPDF